MQEKNLNSTVNRFKNCANELATAFALGFSKLSFEELSVAKEREGERESDGYNCEDS